MERAEREANMRIEEADKALLRARKLQTEKNDHLAHAEMENHIDQNVANILSFSGPASSPASNQAEEKKPSPTPVTSARMADGRANEDMESHIQHNVANILSFARRASDKVHKAAGAATVVAVKRRAAAHAATEREPAANATADPSAVLNGEVKKYIDREIRKEVVKTLAPLQPSEAFPVPRQASAVAPQTRKAPVHKPGGSAAAASRASSPAEEAALAEIRRLLLKGDVNGAVALAKGTAGKDAAVGGGSPSQAARPAAAPVRAAAPASPSTTLSQIHHLFGEMVAGHKQ